MGRASPVVRSPGHSPEKRVTEPVRQGASSPAVGRVPQLRPLERVRQRDLANVPLLPSKYKTDSWGHAPFGEVRLLFCRRDGRFTVHVISSDDLESLLR